MALQVRNLTVTIPGAAGSRVEILRGLDFDAAEGELISVFGPSGCGKTTLLKTLAGLDPQGGRAVLIDDQIAARALENGKVAFAFQQSLLLPWLSAWRNAGWLAELRCSRGRFPTQLVDTMWREFGLADGDADKLPGRMSGGERQRVALIRALSYERASVYLFDEPLSGVGAVARRQQLDYVRSCLKERKAISLLVTHDPIDAVRFGDRILRFPTERSIAQIRWMSMSARSCGCSPVRTGSLTHDEVCLEAAAKELISS